MTFRGCCLAFFVRICILLRFLYELGLYYVSWSSVDELGLYYLNSSPGDDEDSSSDYDSGSSSSSEEDLDSEESVKKSTDSVKDSLEKLGKAQESLDKKDPDNKNLQELQDKHSRELKDTDDAQDFLDKVSRKLKDKFENLKKKLVFLIPRLRRLMIIMGRRKFQTDLLNCKKNLVKKKVEKNTKLSINYLKILRINLLEEIVKKKKKRIL